jgi:chaperone required for assembly of F1-ATPase
MRDLLNDLEAGRHLSDPDPTRRAQKLMKAPLPRRFYRQAAVAEVAEGFAVHLDGKPARTPAKAVLVLPTRQVAELVAAEFAAQSENIDPMTMPVLRLVNTVIDGVAHDTQPIIEDILRFASSDLLCYRAESPERLVERQAETWDPVIDWARAALGARFVLAEGVMHVEQPREAIGAIGIHLRQRDEPFRLSAIHLMTTLMGSALLALAVEAGEIDAARAWAAAHVDEDWNNEHWGEDYEAAQRRKLREADMMAAVKLIEGLPKAGV